MFPGNQGGPLMHVIAAKAVAFKEAQAPEFKTYQQQIVRNAAALAAGLMAHGFRLVSGGTDNHLMLMDLRNTELTGKVAQETLDAAHITVNKQHGAVRDALAVRDQRRPHRHAGGDHARHEGAGDGRHRRLHRPRPADTSATQAALRSVADDVLALCRAFPIGTTRSIGEQGVGSG